MENLPDQQPCHATPDEVAELYKKSLTHFLMIDKIPQFNLKGDKITKKSTVCISPSRVKKTGKCAFKKQDGSCHLMDISFHISGCQMNNILKDSEDYKQKTFRERSSEWITDRAHAVVKFFIEMNKPS
jgi:hypothetical protein